MRTAGYAGLRPRSLNARVVASWETVFLFFNLPNDSEVTIMPFTTEQLDAGGMAAINYFLKNDPVDQINTAHPLSKKLMENKKEYGGGLQYVVEQLRYSNDSNFQSYFGDSQVSYNRKRTLQQAKYSWGSFHDGFGLNEDELAQNGITITDDKSAVSSPDERVNLTNLFQEATETLKLGFQEQMDIMLHRSGAQSATDIPGLDLLVSTTPAVSATVGTLNQATYTWWRNIASLAIADAALIETMEDVWQECTRYGGKAPNFILVGSLFLKKYRVSAGLTVNRQLTANGLQKGGVTMDAGTTAVYFHGVELVWDPVFDVLDTIEAPVVPWTRRCYFLNMDTIKLRPIKGHWMVSRKPPRIYDRYVHYWALTCKAALTTNKRNANAVLSCVP
jgi:hypothetical protein